MYDIIVFSFPVNHGTSGVPFFAYRFEEEGSLITDSGDTEWTDELVEAGAGIEVIRRISLARHFYEIGNASLMSSNDLKGKVGTPAHETICQTCHDRAAELVAGASLEKVRRVCLFNGLFPV